MPLTMPFVERPSHGLSIPALSIQTLDGTGLECYHNLIVVDQLLLFLWCELGHGNFAFVQKMRHQKLNCAMAVKVQYLFEDLHIIMKSKFERIVTFYGAIFHESECWICMELMDSSLDKFYKIVYNERNLAIPEAVLAKITVAIVSALNYLKCELHVIHRDVKPSNVLINKGGDVKLCDFGISGDLVNSLAMTKDVGCKPYMAPERINPDLMSSGYDVRSDVWSLGISLVELATGSFPYPSWRSPFHQLQSVLQSPSPELPPDNKVATPFSPQMREFVNACLQKDLNKRPKYAALMVRQFDRFIASPC
ncbi:unnamed protein product [Mesocestoides corti]|uniref:mitogen-activated protein kinase kinase n=1 Tax=Mesocestoides corti TaxID=53468 RepID=A0A3P6GII4_MESCO|nr:unnamed protein product [Mesocestoides corti]